MTTTFHDWAAAMRAGAYHDAWALEAATIGARDPASRDDPMLPYHLRWVWDGRPFEGRDVLVRCYHGLGDTIQFARYLPLLAERARSVVLEAPPRLIPLLSDLGMDEIVPFDFAAPLPPAEREVEITELAGALQIVPGDAATPYIAWPAAALPPGTIGLCYGAGDWDAERSIPPALLRGVVDRCRLVMLSTGVSPLPCLNPEGCPFDIAATAALVAGVDLVITVDTMIAHLAGAMGKPVWLLLKAEPDWRWSPDRRDSDWYPTMRLYAQPSPGDWRSVASVVAGDLVDLEHGKLAACLA